MSRLTETQPLTDEVAAILARDREVWIAGGAVRDALLGRAVHDLDLVVPRGGLEVARQIADGLRGAFYPLDEERGCGRVVVERGGVRLVVDVADFRAPSIEADLAARDFTINAMARPLGRPGPLLDPTGGRRDLATATIRLTSPAALQDDPLRAWRGARFAAQLGFELEPASSTAMSSIDPHLPGISRERIRDELHRSLDGSRPDRALSLLATHGLLAPVLSTVAPPCDPSTAWNVTLGAVRSLRRLLDTLGGPAAALPDLAPAAPLLAARLAEEPVTGRPARWLLFLALLYAGSEILSEATGSERARHARTELGALRLSRAELRRVTCLLRHARRPAGFARYRLDDRLAHRYLRPVLEVGPELALVAWARAEPGAREALGRLAVATAIPDRLFPRPLLDGGEVGRVADRPVGPWLGRVLASLVEAQVGGSVRTRTEAERFVRRRLDR